MIQKFYALRYISLLAVISCFAGSVLMFVSGTISVINAYLIYFLGRSITILPGHVEENVVASVILIQSVDTFLFALVLLIFAYGIYTLCFGEDQVTFGKLPDWLRVRSISQLKTTLVQVIIVILAVNVLEEVVVVGTHALKWELLIIPASMVGLALALRLMHTEEDT